MWNGYIDLVFRDEIRGERVALGRAGFADAAEALRVFDALPACSTVSPFEAEHSDGSGSGRSGKAIARELVEELLGASAASLITSGRELAAEWQEELVPRMAP